MGKHATLYEVYDTRNNVLRDVTFRFGAGMDSFGTLEGRQDYTIHGQLYARLFFSIEGDKETIIPCQLPSDAFDIDLQVGDRIRITRLMSTVMEIRKASNG